MDASKLSMSRRHFVGVSGLLASAAVVSGGEVHAETATVEKANEKLVNDMCKAIESLDTSKLEPFLAEGLVFQLTDGQPLIEGKETFLQAAAQFFTPYERCEFIVHRSHVIGNLVINERTDNFFAKEGGNDQSFHVSGFFLVKDGKIQEWKDYQIPE